MVDYIILFFLLMFLSALFSSSETAFLAANKHSMEIYAKEKRLGAKSALKLMGNPTKLLSLVLLGNNLVNIGLSAAATIFTVHYFGEQAVFLMTIIVTFAVLILCETIPKAIAVRFADQLTPKYSLFIYPLHLLLNPITTAINELVLLINRVLSLFVKTDSTNQIHNIQKLKGAVAESSQLLSDSHSEMLLGVLDLEKARVVEAMTPIGETEKINISDSLPDIYADLKKAKHNYLAVYEGNVEHCLGFINVTSALLLEDQTGKQKHKMRSLVEEVDFVPENVVLLNVLTSFTDASKAARAFVVDEYGAVLGIITLRDIIIRTMGSINSLLIGETRRPGVYGVSTGVLLRDLNKKAGWDVGADSPSSQGTTLRRLIQEQLDLIPDGPISLEIGDYRLETIGDDEDMLADAKIWRVPHTAPRRASPRRKN